jgi:exonuclease V gamma subunit
VIDLSERYFAVDSKEEPLLQKLEHLKRSLPGTQERAVSFKSVERVLEHFFSSPTSSFHASHLQKISFAPLRLGTTLPAKVIWLLGMEEGNFPRRPFESTLCEIEGADWAPTSLDEDRYQFLELILAARQHFCVSYVRVDPKDHKEVLPSPLVAELLSYLETTLVTIHHPQYKSSWAAEKQPLDPFFDGFAPQKQEDGEQEITISLKQLNNLARHPIRFYFQETLQMFLSEEEDLESGEFLLSALHRFALRKASLQQTASSVLSAADKKGKLPHGVFKELAVDKVALESDVFHKNLEELQINPEDFFSVTLKEEVWEFAQIAPKRFVAPALTLTLANGRVAKIVGRIDNLCPQGWFFYGEEKIADLVKAWPTFLVALQLKARGLPVGEALLLGKEGVCKQFAPFDSSKALQDYVRYFERAGRSLSPLMPDWAEALLFKQADDLEKAISASFAGKFSYQDPYLQWLFARGTRLPHDELFSLWSEYLRALLHPLLEVYEAV